MRTVLFICVSIDIIFISWALRDLLLWHWKITRNIEIQEKMLEMTLWIFGKSKQSDHPQETKPSEAFIQEKIRSKIKRNMF